MAGELLGDFKNYFTDGNNFKNWCWRFTTKQQTKSIKLGNLLLGNQNVKLLQIADT